MHRILPDADAHLHDVAATRRLERRAAAALPAHTLMQRAGLAVARLAMAIAPHARTIWIACGPGNNGGDGFEAAAQLQQRGFAPRVTWCGDEAHMPDDARASLRRARDAGVPFDDAPPPDFDLVIDALLGIGATRAPDGAMAAWLQRMHAGPAPVLAIDVPSGVALTTGLVGPGTSGHRCDHQATTWSACRSTGSRSRSRAVPGAVAVATPPEVSGLLAAFFRPNIVRASRTRCNGRRRRHRRRSDPSTSR